uniref:Uncharacterized protein n=1 Tax=Parascaris univalens TaxID=6257 RepID=A0A915AWJ0_PARUN
MKTNRSTPHVRIGSAEPPNEATDKKTLNDKPDVGAGQLTDQLSDMTEEDEIVSKGIARNYSVSTAYMRFLMKNPRVKFLTLINLCFIFVSFLCLLALITFITYTILLNHRVCWTVSLISFCSITPKI